MPCHYEYSIKDHQTFEKILQHEKGARQWEKNNSIRVARCNEVLIKYVYRNIES